MSYEFDIAVACNKKTDSTLCKPRGFHGVNIATPRRQIFDQQSPWQHATWFSSASDGPQITLDRMAEVAATQKAREATPRKSTVTYFAAFGVPPRMAIGDQIDTVRGFRGSHSPHGKGYGASGAASTASGPTGPGTSRTLIRPDVINPILGMKPDLVHEDRDWQTTSNTSFGVNGTGRPAVLHVPIECSGEASPRGKFGTLPW